MRSISSSPEPSREVEITPASSAFEATPMAVGRWWGKSSLGTMVKAKSQWRWRASSTAISNSPTAASPPRGRCTRRSA